ncbi:isoprenylcysteine carboxylmethyltransferase family protein [Hahella aquimaris]|uniref:methyltransferase family protein n=1 Tax=Hahella sp. HNIBRBA332 TaxID=3015983 RepID=UPI00273B4F80|nr:isoprenylcysteine carboxylmethyltransferase family protein [Hahella sp. HNIBRBA332]WLQ12737.1 isoprenylcysteine carboxylmethyltransferase family protein [Hahella sp. HNIBRBA332]
MSTDVIVSHFLAIFFTMIGVHYTCRSLGLRKRTGVSHIHYGSAASKSWFVRWVFNLFRLLILAVTVARVFHPDMDAYLGVFPAMYTPVVLWTGVGLLLCSFGLIDYVHSYMHTDWRSGIDTDGKTQLLTQGPFRYCRNPLFAGVYIGQIGLFLALPSLFTLACLIIGAGMIAMQTRLEEAALRRAYGQAYERYCERAPRWLPRFGKAMGPGWQD